jgi:DNA (cytosine-5)-methyltransferase 1
LGSLFSGVGGLDLACEQALGVEMAWQVEYDEACQKVLRGHWPDAELYGDVTTLDLAGVEPVDVLCAGWPCQPFSHAGLRKGFDDDRDLWPHVARAIRVLRPRLVVGENVAGFISLGLRRTISELASMGYLGRWGVVRASDAGAPHQRARLFCVAFSVPYAYSSAEHPRTIAPPDGYALLPTPTRSDYKGANGRRNHVGIAPASEHSLATTVALLPTPVVNDMGANKTPEAWDEWTGAMREKHGNGNGHGPSLSIEVQRLLPTPPTRDWKDVGDFTPHPEKRILPHTIAGEDLRGWGQYAPAIARWESILGREAPAPTDDKRRLSPEFVEFLMGFPEGWTEGTRAQRLKMLGNAVCPQQGALALDLLL